MRQTLRGKSIETKKPVEQTNAKAGIMFATFELEMIGKLELPLVKKWFAKAASSRRF